MSITDPIADMFAVIRNAQNARKETVDFTASKVKEKLLSIIKEGGYISNYRVIEDGNKKFLRVYLKYAKNKSGVISGLRRISKSGRRVYANKEKIPYVFGGTGIAILSTSKGIMADKEARRLKIGGEIICYAW